MPIANVQHFRHHGRFYLAFLAGIAVAAGFISSQLGVRAAFGGITFFVIYLASTAWVARRLTADDLRKKARYEDEGILLIVFITLGAITLSLGSLALLLAADEKSAWHLFVALANIPLGWATLHTIMAFHYAHLFYGQEKADGGKKQDRGGLEFPKTKEPTVVDFIYYAFVVGMTAQVSDVDTTSQQMRRVTISHGVVSFFFNTVILAFAVNALTKG